MDEKLPKDCPVCDILEKDQVRMSVVAEHFNEVHPAFVAMLQTAIALEQGMKLGIQVIPVQLPIEFGGPEEVHLG